MAWTTITLFHTGDLVTVSDMNTYVRDNGNETMPAKLTTKGDIGLATAANALARRSVGTNAYVLIADSAETTGAAWKDGDTIAHDHSA